MVPVIRQSYEHLLWPSLLISRGKVTQAIEFKQLNPSAIMMPTTPSIAASASATTASAAPGQKNPQDMCCGRTQTPRSFRGRPQTLYRPVGRVLFTCLRRKPNNIKQALPRWSSGTDDGGTGLNFKEDYI